MIYIVNINVTVNESWTEEGIFQDILSVNSKEYPVEESVGTCNVAFNLNMDITIESDKLPTLEQVSKKVEQLKISSRNGVDILSVDLDEIVSIKEQR